VSKLNVFNVLVHFSEKRIFVWLAQQMRRTQFIEWAQQNGLGNFSHATLRRAMERQYIGVLLTERQKGIEKIAIEFRKTIDGYQDQVSAAA